MWQWRSKDFEKGIFWEKGHFPRKRTFSTNKRHFLREVCLLFLLSFFFSLLSLFFSLFCIFWLFEKGILSHPWKEKRKGGHSPVFPPPEIRPWGDLIKTSRGDFQPKFQGVSNAVRRKFLANWLKNLFQKKKSAVWACTKKWSQKRRWS